MALLNKLTASNLRLETLKPVQYPPMDQWHQKILEAGIHAVLDDALRVGNQQKEFSMPIVGYEINEKLFYTRQPDGAMVLATDALNDLTRAFLTELSEAGFRVTQFYAGEDRPLFSPQGAQRLRLHW